MGDAFIASADNALCVYHNPAALMSLQTVSTDISFGWEGFPLVENWSTLYAKRGYQGKHTGFGFIKQKRDWEGSPYRSFQFIKSSAARISNSIYTGINLKYITQKAGATEYIHKFSLDLGYYQRFGFLNWAFMARNLLEPKMRSFPRVFIFGAAANLGMFIVECDFAGSDWEQLNSEERDIRLGIELNIIQTLSLRGGWEDAEEEEMVSAGFGLHSRLRSTGLEYCYRTPRDDLKAGTHWISYSFLAL